MKLRGIDLLKNCFDCVRLQFVNLRQYVPFNIDLSVRKVCVEILLQLRVRHFIPLLKFAIVLTLLLYSVICQMNHPIAHILYREIFTRCPDVPFLINVPSHIIVHASHKPICSDIEFSFFH